MKTTNMEPIENIENIENKSLTCTHCYKTFSSRQNRWKHEKICKKNQQIILNENNKIINTDNKIINNGTVNNTLNETINNNTINYIINSVGCESVEKLTYEEIKKIFRQHKNCLYNAIEIVNFNENIPENHNFYNSSLEGKYINVFNTETNTPEKKNKKDFFDKLLCSSLNIMQMLYYKVKDNVSKIKQNSLLKMIQELEKIACLSDHKKTYAINVNQISYNKKEIIKKTWNDYSLQNNLLEDDSDDDSDNNIKKYYSDSDSESKDSFYYLTETSESEN